MEMEELLRDLNLAEMHATDEYGNTALHLTVKNETFKQEKMVEYLKILLDKGVNPQIKNDSNKTFLQLAVEKRMKGVIELSITRKISNYLVAHVFIKDEFTRIRSLSTNTDEIQKVITEGVSFVEWLISRGLDFDCKNKSHVSALHKAIDYNLQHILPVMLKCTKDIHFVDDEKRTLLHLFLEISFNGAFNSTNKNLYSQEYAADIVQILLDRGVSADAEDSNKCTPTQMAIKNNAHISVIEILIERCTKISYEGVWNESLLQMVMRRFLVLRKWGTENYIKILHFLIHKGADVKELSEPINCSLQQLSYVPSCLRKPLLCFAVEKYNIPIVNFFHEIGADFNVRTELGRNLLHFLVDRYCQEDIDDETDMTVFNLIIKNGCHLNAKDVNGDTPLHLAVMYKNMTMIRNLIEHGAELNSKNNDDMMPLHVAVVRACNLHVMELLVELGADFGVTAKDGDNSMHLLVKKLVNKYSEDDENGTTLDNLFNNRHKKAQLLDDASRNVSMVILQTLIDHGLDVNCRDNNGTTPLHMALMGRPDLRLVELLRENGADFSVATEDGETLLHSLAKSHYKKIDDDAAIVQIFYLLISEGCQLNVKDMNGNTPLHDAVYRGNIAIIEKIIHVDTETNRDVTPLELSAANQIDDPSVGAFLGENIADSSTKTTDGKSSINLIGDNSERSTADNELIFNSLMSKHCMINAKNKNGMSPIHVAVMYANDLIESSDDAEFHLHLRNEKGVKAVTLLLELLLEHGANVNARDSKGRTALHVAAEACISCSFVIVKFLLEHGVDVNVKDEDGKLALYHAISKEKGRLRPYDCGVKILMKHRIKLDVAKLECYAGSEHEDLAHKQEYDDHREKCLAEVETLKSTFIDKRTSLYTFMHMDLNRRRVYLNNEKLQQLVQSPKLEEQFPEFSVLIMASYREAVTRKSLMKLANVAWGELTEIRLPDICIEIIFSFLSNSDLFNIIEIE